MAEFKDDRFYIAVKDGITIIEWLANEYNYEDVDFGIKKRIEITEGKEYPMFSDLRTAKFGTREARQRLSDSDAGKGIIAVAVLVNSKVQRILYNFFTSIYKDPAPTRLFTDKAEAYKWLEQYK
jgi:hypothetical protein